MTLEERMRRAGTAALFGASLVLTNLTLTGALALRAWGATLGLGLAGALTWLWGERTRPKATFLSWAMGLLVLGGGLAGGTDFWLPLALGLLVGFFLFHDMRLTPTLLLTATVAAALWQSELRGVRHTESEAWWIALSVLVSLIAAVIERDRLARRQGPPMPVAWTGFRVGFLTIWTVGVLAFKENLQFGSVFELIGIDSRGFTGQLTLLAVIVICVVVAGLLFRTRPAKTPAGPPR